MAYRQAWLVLVVCKLALSSLVGYMPALSEEEGVDCKMEPACLQRTSALAERVPWLVVGCAPRGSGARCPTGRSGPATRGAAGARTLLQGVPSTSLRNLRWSKTAEKMSSQVLVGQQWSWSYLWWRREVDDRWLLSGVDDRSSILDLRSIRVLCGSVRL